MVELTLNTSRFNPPIVTSRSSSSSVGDNRKGARGGSRDRVEKQNVKGRQCSSYVVRDEESSSSALMCQIGSNRGASMERRQVGLSIFLHEYSDRDESSKYHPISVSR